MKPIDKIKQLREITGLPVMECKNALEKSGYDLEKAKEILKERFNLISAKKIKKETKEGIVASYIHQTKKIGVLLEILCQSDFVANSPQFQNLAHEICLQIAAQNPSDIDSLMAQPWIKDETRLIGDLIKENIVKFGENIVLKRFVRYEI